MHCQMQKLFMFFLWRRSINLTLFFNIVLLLLFYFYHTTLLLFIFVFENKIVYLVIPP